MTFYGRLTDLYTEVIWFIISDSLVVSAIRFEKTSNKIINFGRGDVCLFTHKRCRHRSCTVW